MARPLFMILSVLSVLFSATNAAAACQRAGNITIRGKADVRKYQEVCSARTVTIFADDADVVVLPALEKAGLINVDSRSLRALALPALREVRDLYIQGMGLEIAEFPSLSLVSGRFAVLNQNLRFMNLPALISVGRMLVQNCPNLEFIFADKLQTIGSSEFSGNISLNSNVIQILENLTLLTPEQYRERQEAAERMRLYRNELILRGAHTAPSRPTGHPTEFRDYVNEYYDYYPSAYHDYWLALSPWGFAIWYRL